jgi:hypothetical protein
MTAQEPAMAMVNQMMPRSGQPKRFSFHMETNERTTQVKPRNTISHRLKAIIVSWGCTRPTFGEPSVWRFGCVLLGSWGCGTSLSVGPGSCFMILLPGGGSLFEITSSPLRSLVDVIVLGLALRNDSKPKKKGETRCKIQSRTSPPNADSTGLCPVSCGWGYVDPR